MSATRRTNQRCHFSPRADSRFHDLYLRTQIDREISEKKDLVHRCLVEDEESARGGEGAKVLFEPASVLERPPGPTLGKDNSTKFLDSLLLDITKSSSKIKTLNIL